MVQIKRTLVYVRGVKNQASFINKEKKMMKINIDKILKEHTFYKSILLEVYKQNKEQNRKIRRFLEKSDIEDF